MTIAVKFPMTEEIWNTVVTEAGEDEGITVLDEKLDHFIVDYPHDQAWCTATARFEGMVKHEVLPTYNY